MGKNIEGKNLENIDKSQKYEKMWRSDKRIRKK